MFEILTMSTAIQSELNREEPPAAGWEGIRPHRPAWIEIDLARLRHNYQVINQDKPKPLKILSVVKDDAYGHGALHVARTALAAGAAFLGLATLEEGDAVARSRPAMRGCCSSASARKRNCPGASSMTSPCASMTGGWLEKLGRIAARAGKRVPVHVKINTGMNRYGVRWSEACRAGQAVGANKSLELEGVMSHFSMSDEMDKTFALLQLARFNEVLSAMADAGHRRQIPPPVQQRRLSRPAPGAFRHGPHRHAAARGLSVESLPPHRRH